MTGDRFARLCPTHHTVLEEKGTALICPRGGHAVAAWKVVDREKGTAVMSATEDPKGKEGVEDMRQKMTPGRSAEAGGRRHHLPAAGPLESAPRPAATPGKKTGVLGRWKATDDAGAALWIRLVCQPSKLAGDVFYVRWQKVEKGKATTSGVSYAGDAQGAKAAFETKQKEAERAGWSVRPVTSGREIKYTPLPAPSKKGRP